MSTRELHENIAVEMVSRGLPVEYAERTAAELSDHHGDLVEELIAAGSDELSAQAEASNRLGDQKTLIKKSVREYQRRHWCGRWPLLTFLFGPVVLLVLSWTFMCLALAGIGMLREALGIEPMPPLGTVNLEKYIVCTLCKGWAVFLMPALIIYVLAKFASRAALGKPWIFLSACILATVVGTHKLGFNQAGDAFYFDLPLVPLFYKTFPELISWYAGDFSQACQLLLPLVVAGIFLWRTQQLAQCDRRNQVAGM